MKSKEISKLISYWLRHMPADGNLNLDEFGRVKIDLLLEALNGNNIAITKNQLIELNNSFDKKRWEIDGVNNTIRATHGHSISIKQVLSPKEPPNLLYHGTSLNNIQSIFESGLRKMEREYVHLSSSPIEGLKIGQRHGRAVVLEIETEELLANGFCFYNTENDIWLSSDIPSGHMTLAPWYRIDSPEIQHAIKSELMKEVGNDDQDLNTTTLTSFKATWRNQTNDEVLFQNVNGECYHFKLTWSSSHERRDWLYRKNYDSFIDWLKVEVIQSQKNYYNIY